MQFCGGDASCGCIHEDEPGALPDLGRLDESQRAAAVIQRRGDTADRGGPYDPGRVLGELGAGIPVPAQTAAAFESAYSVSLDQVQVHADSPIPARHGARALTVGHHIVFAPGRFQPDTEAGQELIGHELAHVVQQQGGTGSVQAAAGPASAAHELEADSAARSAVNGEPVQGLSPVTAPERQADSEPAAANESYEDFKQRVFAKAKERLDHNVAALGEWRTYLGELTGPQLRTQSISALTMEYAVRAAAGPAGQYRFERWAGTDEPAEQAFRGAQLSTDAPAKELAGTFMAFLSSRAFGHLTGPTRAQQLQVAAGTLSEKDLPAARWVPPDPRFRYYGEIITRFRKGEQGGCQTCHDINREWARMIDTYGSPLPDPLTSTFGGSFGSLPGTSSLGASSRLLTAPDRAMIETWLSAPPSGRNETGVTSGGSGATAVQKKVDGPAIQHEGGPLGKPPTGGVAGLPGQAAPRGVDVPAPHTDLCGELPPQDTSTTAAFDPAKWGPASTAAADALRVLGTVLEPLGPRGYRIIPHHTFDQLWTAGPEDIAALRASILSNLDERVEKYKTLKTEISAGLVPYEELCPIVDELLPTTNEAVRSAVLTEIRLKRIAEKIIRYALLALSLALLLFAFIFPPAIMISAPMLALSLGTAVAGVAVGAQDVRRGHQWGLAQGARVVSHSQEAMADSLRIMGAITLVASTIGLASWMRTVSGLAGATEAAAIAGAGSRPIGMLPGVHVIDTGGGRFLLFHPDFPSEFAVLTGDGGLTMYRMVGGVARPIVYWAPASVEAAAAGAVVVPEAGSGLMSLRPTGPPVSGVPPASGVPPVGVAPPVTSGALSGPLTGAAGSVPLLTGPPAAPLLTGGTGGVVMPPGIDPSRVIPLAGGGGFLFKGPILTPPPQTRLLLPETTNAPLPPGDWTLSGLWGTPGLQQLPPSSLPYAGSRAWGYTGGSWGLFKPLTAPEVPVTLQIYTGPSGERSLLLDIPGETRSLHTEPLVLGGTQGRAYPMRPSAMTDPQTGGGLARSHLDPHYRSRPDLSGSQSTRDPLNYVGHDQRYNEWVRRTLERRLDKANAHWQAIQVWTTPRLTTGGYPIVTEEIIIQMDATGTAVRAWRFPTTEGYYDSLTDIEQILGPRSQGGFEIPLAEVPPTLRGGGMPP